jgi:hypothetical protein
MIRDRQSRARSGSSFWAEAQNILNHPTGRMPKLITFGASLEKGKALKGGSHTQKEEAELFGGTGNM